MNWSLFTIRGSNGSLMMWHLAMPDGKSMCGRMFRVNPERISKTAPEEIRGVCRMCERMERRDRELPALVLP
jgi:hypothetical protein